ncbi:MAG TPA: site-specific integrase [Dehalococcoidia bacterium]|nr:site-specific integrase [Dehalococcoidia bacterium]
MKRRANHEGSYVQRRGRWEACIRIAGHRYWVSGRTRQECRERLQALLLRHQAGQLAPPSRLTLEEWAREWLERGGWRPSTLRRYRQALAPLLLRLGRARLSRLEPWHIAVALGHLDVGSRTRELAYVALHACLNEALRMGLLASNPCSRVPRPRHQPREARDWTLQDMRRFLSCALSDPSPIAQMLALMLTTGLRPGEALGLRWDDVDLAAATLTVRRSVTWVGSEWHVGRPKTKAGERAVALPALAVSLLSRLPREGVYVFWRERPPYSKRISEKMTGLCERAGVPRRPAHYLRHAHASLLVHLGVDVKTAQRRLGHASANMTLDVYAHHLAEGERRLASLLNQALGG